MGFSRLSFLIVTLVSSHFHDIYNTFIPLLVYPIFSMFWMENKWWTSLHWEMYCVHTKAGGCDPLQHSHMSSCQWWRHWVQTQWQWQTQLWWCRHWDAGLWEVFLGLLYSCRHWGTRFFKLTSIRIVQKTFFFPGKDDEEPELGTMKPAPLPNVGSGFNPGSNTGGAGYNGGYNPGASFSIKSSLYGVDCVGECRRQQYGDHHKCNIPGEHLGSSSQTPFYCSPSAPLPRDRLTSRTKLWCIGACVKNPLTQSFECR